MSAKDTLDQDYRLMLKKFCDNFEEKMVYVSQRDGHKMGYVFVIDRAIEVAADTGQVDVASNLSSDAIIHTLEKLLDSLREQRDIKNYGR